MTVFQCAALIYGPEQHHLDHLAPLCVLMRIPLIVTEETIFQLASRYYPSLEVYFFDYLHVAERIVSQFDVIFYSIPRDLFDETFFFAQKLFQKKIHTIWCPHGNSDKGNGTIHLEALKKEEIALVYGKQMIEFLKRKNVFDQLKAHIITGNYRYEFYLENKLFFDGVIKREIQSKLPLKKFTLLYAPTWKDYENSSSFFSAISPLVESLPESHNLIVKIHPNLLLQEPFKTEDLLEKYSFYPNVLILKEFPLIYPLLNIVDIYIGDRSSIGYDFLSQNRPMFFLNQSEKSQRNDLSTYLFRCGVEILPKDFENIHSIITHHLQYEIRDFTPIRKDVYSQAFHQKKSLAQLKTEIENSLNIFPDPELNFF